MTPVNCSNSRHVISDLRQSLLVAACQRDKLASRANCKQALRRHLLWVKNVMKRGREQPLAGPLLKPARAADLHLQSRRPNSVPLIERHLLLAESPSFGPMTPKQSVGSCRQLPTSACKSANRTLPFLCLKRPPSPPPPQQIRCRSEPKVATRLNPTPQELI